MIRFLNLLALVAVIGSATWAYSVKYETVLVAEKVKKRQGELARERDAIAVLEAEWQLLNRPARLAALAKPEPGMGQLSARQVVEPRQIPAATPQKADPLDSLLTGSLPPAPKAAPTSGTAPKAASPAKTTPKAGTAKTTPKAAAKDAAKAAPKATTKAPLALASGAPKTAAPKTAAPKAAAPVRLAPQPAPAPKAESGGLGALLKKIIP